MMDCLRGYFDSNDSVSGHLAHSLLCQLEPSRHDNLRARSAAKMRLLTARQRLAIAHFVEVSAHFFELALLEAWRRVAEFDAFDGTDQDDGSLAWFDVFWPFRFRPTSAAVSALIKTAFERDQARELELSEVTDGPGFRATFRAGALKHLAKLKVEREPARWERGPVEEALHSPACLKPEEIETHRQRLEGLSLPQRKAIYAFLQHGSSDRALIAAWGRAVATSDGWFEALLYP